MDANISYPRASLSTGLPFWHVHTLLPLAYYGNPGHSNSNGLCLTHGARWTQDVQNLDARTLLSIQVSTNNSESARVSPMYALACMTTEILLLTTRGSRCQADNFDRQQASLSRNRHTSLGLDRCIPKNNAGVTAACTGSNILTHVMGLFSIASLNLPVARPTLAVRRDRFLLIGTFFTLHLLS
jgi:hypothetical protein